MDQGSPKRQCLSTSAHYQNFELERQIYNIQAALRLSMPRVEEKQRELDFYQEQLYITRESHKDLLRRMSSFPLSLWDPALAIPTEEKIIEEISHPSSR